MAVLGGLWLCVEGTVAVLWREGGGLWLCVGGTVTMLGGGGEGGLWLC